MGNSTKQTVTVNLNATAYVQLTEKGHAELRRQHDELSEQYPNIFGAYKPCEEDEDGWSSWQLHIIMEKLGYLLINGGTIPFQPNIKVVCDDTLTEDNVGRSQ
jgi:hypothetical protein